MKADFVYIEVENFQRDLRWRLDLAKLLVQDHHTVVIGRVDQTEKFAKRTKFTGLYFLKDCAYTRLELIKKLSQKNKVIVLDEESFSCSIMPEKHLHFRVSDLVLAEVDYFFCSFREEYTFLVKNRADYKSKLMLTGNPRFKFVRLPQTTMAIRKILVPFSYYFKPLVGEQQRRNQIEIMKCRLPLNLRQQYERTYDQLAEGNARLLAETLKYAQKYPTYQFILRPHPSCVHDFKQYERSNVTVSNKLTIDDDIKDVDLVLHTNCTSGVDSLSNGVPAVNLFRNIYTAGNEFKNMKELMGQSLDEFPLYRFEHINIKTLKTSNEIPDDPLDTIFKRIIMEVNNVGHKSINFRPKLIDLCKLSIRKDRLLSIVRKMIGGEFRIKSLQNQVLQLELNYASKL